MGPSLVARARCNMMAAPSSPNGPPPGEPPPEPEPERTYTGFDGEGIYFDLGVDWTCMGTRKMYTTRHSYTPEDAMQRLKRARDAWAKSGKGHEANLAHTTAERIQLTAEIERLTHSRDYWFDQAQRRLPQSGRPGSSRLDVQSAHLNAAGQTTGAGIGNHRSAKRQRVEELEEPAGNSYVNATASVNKAFVSHPLTFSPFTLLDWCKKGRWDGKICGIYMPTPMWFYDQQVRKVFCHVGWNSLETTTGGRYINKWMSEHYGHDKECWPQPCCGSSLQIAAPYMGNNIYKLLEINVQHEVGPPRVEVLVCETLPMELEQEIFKHHDKFQKALAEVSPTEILPLIPDTVRKKDVRCAGIGRFDVEDWFAIGKPILSQVGWFNLIKTICRKDPENLHDIIKLCDQMMATSCGTARAFA